MRRELQTEQMRRRILDSALEVFGAEGYDGASMNAICTRAGISKGIIYHYFAGKEVCTSAAAGRAPRRWRTISGAYGVRGDAPGSRSGEFLALRHRFFGEVSPV